LLADSAESAGLSPSELDQGATERGTDLTFHERRSLAMGASKSSESFTAPKSRPSREPTRLTDVIGSSSKADA
jgi:hypothetical protein